MHSKDRFIALKRGKNCLGRTNQKRDKNIRDDERPKTGTTSRTFAKVRKIFRAEATTVHEI